MDEFMEKFINDIENRLNPRKGDHATAKAWIAENSQLFTDGAIDALITSINIVREPSQIERTILIYKALSEVVEEQGNYARAVSVLMDFGQFLRQYRIFDDALDCYQRAHQIALTHLDPDTRYDCLERQAVIYQHVDLFPQALTIFEQVLAYSQQTGDRRYEAGVIGNLAATYRAMGNYTRALELHNRALSIFRQDAEFLGILDPSIYHSISIELFNMGMVYEQTEDIVRALASFTEGLSTIRSITERAKYRDPNAMMKNLMGMMSNTEQPGPHIELEVNFLIRISICANTLGQVKEFSNARHEANELVQRFHLHQFIDAINSLFTT